MEWKFLSKYKSKLLKVTFTNASYMITNASITKAKYVTYTVRHGSLGQTAVGEKCDFTQPITSIKKNLRWRTGVEVNGVRFSSA